MKKQIKIVVVIIISATILFSSYFLVKLASDSVVQNPIQKTKSPLKFNLMSRPTPKESIPIVKDEIEELSYEKGLFSWSPYTIKMDKRNLLYQVLVQLDIDELYQYYDDIEPDNYDAYTLASVLNEIDVDLYILAGSSDWTYDPLGTPMINEIQRAVEFREHWGDDALTGIVFDIEPYDSELWIQGHKDQLMKNYISGMKAAYAEAQKENLRIILCIPTWYDVDHLDTLLQLLNYCDEISVMNYGRKYEYEHMIDEINYARDLDMDITSIFEFQAVGLHNLTDEQTYHNLGIEAANASFESLYSKADYENLKFAYHYLVPLIELLEIEVQKDK